MEELGSVEELFSFVVFVSSFCLLSVCVVFKVESNSVNNFVSLGLLGSVFDIKRMSH